MYFGEFILTFYIILSLLFDWETPRTPTEGILPYVQCSLLSNTLLESSRLGSLILIVILLCVFYRETIVITQVKLRSPEEVIAMVPKGCLWNLLC